MPNAKISALGCYTPPRVLTNQDLEKLIDTSDELIMEHTGIRERHIAGPEMATSDMVIEAARRALAQRGVDATEIDAILVCTVTPDHLFPSTACLVQHGIGAKSAWGFDLIAACCGFLYGLTVGSNLVMAGTSRKALVIGSDTMSRITDYERTNCVLFGDGAGAMLIEPAGEEDGGAGFIDFLGEIDGSGADFKMPAGGSRRPASHETVDQRLHYLHQDGPRVFKYASRKMHEVCRQLLERNHLSAEDVGIMIPHQASKRIITAAAEELGIAPERVMINLESYGNTTAGTLPLATRDAISAGRLKKGDIVLFAAVGAGYTVGAALWRWAY